MVTFLNYKNNDMQSNMLNSQKQNKTKFDLIWKSSQIMLEGSWCSSEFVFAGRGHPGIVG